MALHERYMNFKTLDISMLTIIDASFTGNPLELLHRLIQSYNNDIEEGNISTKKLETFRMILCYEYQWLLNSDKKRIPFIRKELCFNSLEKILSHNLGTNSELRMPIYYDIIILQLVLYCDIAGIAHRLESFIKCINSGAVINHESKFLSTKIMHCFLEAISLYSFVYADIDEDNLRKMYSIFLGEIQASLRAKEDIEWKLLALNLPKFVEAFNTDYILTSTYDMILTEVSDLKNTLTAFCIMADTYFPLKVHQASPKYIDLCVDDRFWQLIVKGLESATQQFRKQALFLMKRVIDVVAQLRIENASWKRNVNVPFTFCCNKECSSKIDAMKEQYFLIIDALEEKQNHLVAPALSHLPQLMKGYEEHLSCNNCLNIVWIRCMFKRILQHESNAVVKRGLLYVCKMDVNLYDDEFLRLFINVLNNPFLYECQPDEDIPEIVGELSELFRRGAANSEARFVRRFLSTSSEVSWGPVALFYTIRVLREASTKFTDTSSWEEPEIDAVKSLASGNLQMHSLPLRVASQVEILRTTCNCLKSIANVSSLAIALATFPGDEALSRGSFAWNLVSDWLTRTLPKEKVEEVTKRICDAYVHENDPENAVEPRYFAFMVALFHDANIAFRGKNCPAARALRNWMDFIIDAAVRPYSKIDSDIRVTEFMARLMKFCSNDRQECACWIIAPYIDDALKFLLRNLRRVAQNLDFEDVKKYLEIVQVFLSEHHLIPRRETTNYVEKFYEESVAMLENTENHIVRYFCALKIRHFCQHVLIASSKGRFQIRPFVNRDEITTAKGADVNVRGKIISDCCLVLANLTLQYVEELSLEFWPTKTNTLENAAFFFEMGGQEVVPVVARILTVFVDKDFVKLTNDTENLKELFTVCWNSTFASKMNATVWEAAQRLLGVVVNSNFLNLTDGRDFTREYVDKLLAEAETTPSLKRILLSRMARLDAEESTNFQEPLLDCLLHGHAARRDKRIESQACLRVSESLAEHYAKFASIADVNVDATIRAHSAKLLHGLIAGRPAFASTFLPRVLARLAKIRNKRYFNHSSLHRVKHRMMQVLLILQPALDQTSTKLLQETMCDSLLSESNQHSVRLMQEWILIRIFLENEDLHCKLWKLYAESIATRPGCTNSLASMVYHIAKLLPIKKRLHFIEQSLPYVSQCCCGQQFSMRLYNQVVLVKLYEMLPESNASHILTEYKGLYNATIESLKQGNFMKNAIKIQDDFYFTIFHPTDDYSLQTIYWELPRLTNMERDECSPPELFKVLDYENNELHPLRLFNANDSLASALIPPHFMKSSASCAETLLQNEQDELSGLSDIQKKINPYKSIMPFYNDTLESYNIPMTSAVFKQEEEGLTVVASLIDRVPNLGGLARTCEIFGVQKLIISNLNSIKDKDFQTLSVSAEKWLTIVEVKPHLLREYLIAQKDLGCSLIGIEQTANSKSLSKMKFDKKTVLVLGNEKDGMPANLIPLFDTCVEIPQVGLIRSLNVHVSGAICIWQYANQHIFV